MIQSMLQDYVEVSGRNPTTLFSSTGQCNCREDGFRCGRISSVSLEMAQVYTVSLMPHSETNIMVHLYVLVLVTTLNICV